MFLVGWGPKDCSCCPVRWLKILKLHVCFGSSTCTCITSINSFRRGATASNTSPYSALSELCFRVVTPPSNPSLMTDSRPKTSWNLSRATTETHTLWGHHNTAAAQTALGLLCQILVSGLTRVMCRLISSGIVLTKQVSVKSEMSSKTKRVCVCCFFFYFALMWSICQSSAKCYSGSDIRTLEGLHCERGFLIWFLRTESLVKRKELLGFL